MVELTNKTSDGMMHRKSEGLYICLEVLEEAEKMVVIAIQRPEQ